MLVLLLSTAPQSQLSEVERLSQFDIATFIDNEGIFETQLEAYSMPQSDEDLANHIKSQFFLQDEEVEAWQEKNLKEEEKLNNKLNNELDDDLLPLAAEPVAAENITQFSCELPTLMGHLAEINNIMLIDCLNTECQIFNYAISNFHTYFRENHYILGCDYSGQY
ncbi:hypothetical protein FQN51_001426 [Onygenales sp. PD_10]|nr:hypothetical protein FQN51_001426 [Onygenales sp. PD_10]